MICRLCGKSYGRCPSPATRHGGCQLRLGIVQCGLFSQTVALDEIR
jgi:hypothetical protein